MSVSTPLSLARPLILMTAMTLPSPASISSTGSTFFCTRRTCQARVLPENPQGVLAVDRAMVVGCALGRPKVEVVCPVLEPCIQVATAGGRSRQRGRSRRSPATSPAQYLRAPGVGGTRLAPPKTPPRASLTTPAARRLRVGDGQSSPRNHGRTRHKHANYLRCGGFELGRTVIRKTATAFLEDGCARCDESRLARDISTTKGCYGCASGPLQRLRFGLVGSR